MKKKFTSVLLIAALFLVTLSVATAAPTQTPGNGNGPPDHAARPDDLPHPLGEQRRALRAQAMEAKAQGKAHGKTHEVARGQFVELEREGEDPIWTVLGEFANYEHNSIPEPDRSVNNTTYWVEDFNRDHYMDMLFSEEPGAISMRNYYIEQSSNRYTVNGDVTDWVQVPGDAVEYGVAFSDTWFFVRDSINAWYQSQLDAGMSPAEIDDYLSQFDVWDRYDYDGDGNFDEPDGYIDHFQSVHSGEGEEAGGGELGADAIWSHRWYVQLTPVGAGGPTLEDGTQVPFGGVQIGDSSYWIGDYTAEPENGGVGVFAHEFAHDLGLPDLYDTAGGENSTAFWTVMSSGSWMGEGGDHIGTKPNHFGAWEKFQLGWLDYDVAVYGQNSSHRLGPAETTTKQAQALITVLPDKEVATQIGQPFAGDFFYYSGAGNNLDNWMYREFDLPAGASLTAQVDYDIEDDWDYAYLVVSTDGGANWEPVETSESTDTNPNGQNLGHGITGNSQGWTELTADLSAYEGNVLLGFRYWTDVAVIEDGLMVDEISVAGETYGAESDAGWTFDGFRVTDGLETSFHFNAYIAAYRQYRGYDDTLPVGPYNFGFLDNPDLGDWVEHFPYMDGLLINYWDTSQTNNNVSQHPGEGLILPIDAHYDVMYRADGGVWRNRIQAYDATFGLDDTEPLTLHWMSQPSHHPSQPAVPVFDDSILHWHPDNPSGSVKHPNTGLRLSIKNTSAQGNFMQVTVQWR